MNENQKDVEFEEEIEDDKENLEFKKKEDEVAIKRKDACLFKTDDPNSLKFNESDPYFRTPLTDIIESKEGYYIFVELPGLNKNHVKISLQDEILELSGEKKVKDKEKKEEKKDKEKKDKKDKKDEKKDKDKKKEEDIKIAGDYLRREIRSTNFFRCYQLPEDISSEEIDASFKNGILKLRIPKKTAKLSEKQIIDIK